MSVRRGPLPADRYTVIANDWLRDASLSWKAKGLLAYLVSHAAGYDLSHAQIVGDGRDGRDGVTAGLRELETAGYLRRTQARDPETGRVGEGVDYLLLDPDSPSTDNPETAPLTENPETGVTCDDAANPQVTPGNGFAVDGESAPKKNTSFKKTKKTSSTTDDDTTTPDPRGTRLPAGWIPPEAVRRSMLDRYPGRSAQWWLDLTDAFTDYWKGAPGQRGVKRDWDATWRNWVRNAVARERGPVGRAEDTPRYWQQAGPPEAPRVLPEGYGIDGDPR